MHARSGSRCFTLIQSILRLVGAPFQAASLKIGTPFWRRLQETLRSSTSDERWGVHSRNVREKSSIRQWLLSRELGVNVRLGGGGGATVSCKGPDSKTFRLWGSDGLTVTTQPPLQYESTIDNL